MLCRSSSPSPTSSRSLRSSPSLAGAALLLPVQRQDNLDLALVWSLCSTACCRCALRSCFYCFTTALAFLLVGITTADKAKALSCRYVLKNDCDPGSPQMARYKPTSPPPLKEISHLCPCWQGLAHGAAQDACVRCAEHSQPRSSALCCSAEGEEAPATKDAIGPFLKQDFCLELGSKKQALTTLMRDLSMGLTCTQLGFGKLYLCLAQALDLA